MEKRKLNFANLSIEVSESLFNYSIYKQKFHKLASEKANIFYTEFYNKFKDMDDLAENGFQYGLELIKSVIDVAVDELVKRGMYDVNEEYFIVQFVSKYFLWENDFNQLLEAYYKICLTEEEAKQYRENRKKNRSRWSVLSTSGTYFEALDAQLTAGMRNFVEGIGHSIFNAIGNAASKAVANAQKKKLFYASETVTALTQGVYSTCFNIHYALIDALKEYTDIQILSKDELLEAKNKVDRLLENLIKGRIPSDDKEKVLEIIISLYPYDIELYKYLIEENFDIRDITKLASYFSVDISKLLFGESFLEIRTNIDNYDFAKRSELFSIIKRIGKINPEFDREINQLYTALLFYNGKQYRTVDELLTVMKSDKIKEEEKLKQLIACFKEYESNSSLYIYDIPESKINNAFQYYNIPNNETILVLIDNTVMGSAKKGIAFCKRGIYIKTNTENNYLSYQNISMIKDIKISIFGVTLILSDNSKIDMDLSGSQFNKSDLFTIMSKIVEIYTGKKIVQSLDKENRKIDTPDNEIEMSNPEISAKGVNGQIDLYPDKVCIRRKGVIAFLTQGLKSDKNIMLSTITSVEFKKASKLLSGYIQFVCMDGHEAKGGKFQASRDENTVKFTVKQQPVFEQIRDAVENRIQTLET
jgi:hypothetical protein